MDRRAYVEGGRTDGQGGFIPRRAERSRSRAERIETATARARTIAEGGVRRPIVSRTPVVEWSGCGDAYRAPGVVAPRPVAAAPCSRASCTWTNARNAAAAAVSPAAGPR